MSIENSHPLQAPDFPPKGPTDPEVTTEGAGDSVPDTAYELLGGVPGDAQASAANFKYPSSSGPEAAWTQEQIDAYDPTVMIDPKDTTFAQRLTEQAATTQVEQDIQPDKKSKKGLFAIGAGVTTLLVAGAAFFGANAAKDSSKNETLPPEPTPTASAPVTPGAQESATPTAVVTPPAPQPTETQPQTGELSNKAAEYNMTDAEYQQIVDSFKIDMTTHPTPESALAAFNEKMTSYFNGGHNKADHEKNYEWSAPNTAPGWNSWANQVYTSAVQESMFDVNYIQTNGNYIQKMIDLKTESNRMWANTNRSSQPDYKMAFNLVPKEGIKVFDNGGFIAYGDIVYSDNAADSSATATDSHAIGTYSIPDESVAMAPDEQTNTWRVTRIITGMPFGK